MDLKILYIKWLKITNLINFKINIPGMLFENGLTTWFGDAQSSWILSKLLMKNK